MKSRSDRNPNYDVTKTDALLTVTKAVATVVADAKSRFYGAANPALTAVVTGQVAGGDAVAYTLATTAVQLSPVGTYPIEVTLGSNPNYDVTKTDALLTVTKAVATVVADAKNRFYGAANPALTAVVTGQVAGGDAVAYTLATTAVQLSPVGTYPIEVTLGSNPNYDVTKTDALLTVTKAVATVVADAKNRFYGAANPALTAVVTGQVAGGDAVAYTLATTAVQLSPVGTYPIEVTLGSNPNYDVTKTDALLTVTKAVATVVADAKSRFYGAANPALTAVVTGQVAGGDAVAYTLATTAVQLSPVGTYPIEVTLGSNPNYDVTKTDALLTVTKAVATVVADAKNRFYGAANPALTAVVTGQVAGGDAVAYTLATTAVQLSPVGTYPIEVTLGSNPNYDVTKTDALLTVTKAVATVVADAKNRFYGAANPALTAVVTGQVAGGDAVAYTLATTAVQLSPVGTYPIEVTLGSNPNYDVTKTDALLTVTKAVATVVADAKNRFYGAANPALTAVVTGQVAGGDAVAYTLATTAVQLSPVGTYPIEVTLGSNPNYAVTKTDAALTITKATLTVTADDKTKLLNAPNPAFTASYSGFVNNETLATSGVTGTPAFTTTALANSPVGKYPITAALGTLTSANYTFVFNNGTHFLTVLYAWDGFLQPINDTAHDLGIMSRFKAGQTIPAKFDLKDANGVTVTQTVNPMFGLALIGAACGTSAPDSIDFPEPPSSVPVYTLNGGHYQYQLEHEERGGGPLSHLCETR